MPLPTSKDRDEKAKIKKWLDGRTIVSGFCGNGFHEGTKPLTKGGNAMKVCELILTCPCECHYNIDEMFAMTGMARVPMTNPDYKPDLGNFVMPSPDAEDPFAPAPYNGLLHAEPEPGGVDVPTNTEQPAAANVATPTTPLAERRGPSGVSARGGLEARVWHACSEMPGEPTPAAIGDWMVAEYKIPTPSSGAIREVFIRWEKMGFAEWAQKPNRFVKFLGEGTWAELSELKGKAKRQKLAAQSAASRTIR